MSGELIVMWLILGLIVGFLASRLMGSGGYGLIGDIVVGILGAIVGGWLATQFVGIGVTGVNLTSIVIGVIGAIILIVLFRVCDAGTSHEVVSLTRFCFKYLAER